VTVVAMVPLGVRVAEVIVVRVRVWVVVVWVGVRVVVLVLRHLGTLSVPMA